MFSASLHVLVLVQHAAAGEDGFLMQKRLCIGWQVPQSLLRQNLVALLQPVRPVHDGFLTQQ
jgi:hypothetical protein